MKNVRRFWQSLPKSTRLVFNLLVIATLVFCLYTFISAPPFTTQVQYRRVEKAHFVGPAQILGMEEQSFCELDRIVLADDGEGVIVYAESTRRSCSPELIYREKTGPVTIVAVPNSNPFDEKDTRRQLTVAAFDSCPQAVRAELTITLKNPAQPYFEKTYHLETSRTNAGYFCFLIDVWRLDGIGREGQALQVFSRISGYVGRYYMDTVIPATLRLYDSENNLIEEHSISIRSVEAHAHSEREELQP